MPGYSDVKNKEPENCTGQTVEQKDDDAGYQMDCNTCM